MQNSSKILIISIELNVWKLKCIDYLSLDVTTVGIRCILWTLFSCNKMNPIQD